MTDDKIYLFQTIEKYLYENFGPFDDYLNTDRRVFIIQSVAIWTCNELIKRILDADTIDECYFINDEEIMANFLEELYDMHVYSSNDDARYKASIAYDIVSDILYEVTE